jgi:uncharacterized protein YutE (UPF0331/DUF86 family)
LVVAEVLKKITIPKRLLDIVEHYYGLRNKLVHERATVGITDADVEIFKSAVEQILTILFDLRFPE